MMYQLSVRIYVVLNIYVTRKLLQSQKQVQTLELLFPSN